LKTSDEDGFSRLTISATTVMGWIVGLSTVAIWLGWAWLHADIDRVEQTASALEQRVHNLEENVLWKRDR
jgi:hypothetical protein